MLLNLLLSLTLFAADPINPMTLCDRFLAKEEIKECEFRIKATRPDWYLAGVCQQQFDNEAFFECLSLSRGNNFDPIEIQKCAGTEMNDSERMGCLQGIAKATPPQFEKEKRSPASKKKAVKKPDKKNSPKASAKLSKGPSK